MRQAVTELSREVSYKDHSYKSYQRLMDHKSYLLRFSNLLPIEPLVADKYRGDFYGLLDQLNIGIKYHYPTLLINGLDSPQEYNGETVIFVLSQNNEIDRILNE